MGLGLSSTLVSLISRALVPLLSFLACPLMCVCATLLADAPSTYKRDRIALLMRVAGLSIPPATWPVAVMETRRAE